MPAVSWALRILLGVGGLLLVHSAAPVAWGALHAIAAKTVVDRLREGKPVAPSDALAAIAELDAAVAADPPAHHRLALSELLASLASTLPGASDGQREQWLRTAQADLETGLAGAPGHGIAWLRLARVRHALGGPSRRVVEPLLMSIETAPVVPRLWPVRLELILRNWGEFKEPELERVAAYVVMTWRASSDRRWFVWAMRQPLDELLVRILLANQPGAQEELNVWRRLVRP